MEPDLNKLKNNWLNFAEHGILDGNTRPIIQRSWEYCKKINMDVNGGKVLMPANWSRCWQKTRN